MIVARVLALPADERRALVSATLRLTATHLLLATAGVPRTRRLLERRRANGVDAARAERCARAVLRASRHLPLRTNCLDHAIALWWMLTAAGLDATLRIGVKKRDDATLAAHAWVEHGGAVLLDDTAAHYAALDTPILVSGGER